MRRAALLPALATALLCVAPAHAARCPQVSDPRGDDVGNSGLHRSPATDVRALRLARSGAATALVVEVDDFGEADPSATHGFGYHVYFRAGGQSYFAQAAYTAYRREFSLHVTDSASVGPIDAFTGSGQHPVDGSIDTARDRLTVLLPDGIAPGIDRGVQVVGAFARSWTAEGAGVDVMWWGQDETYAAPAYAIGTPGCAPR